MAGRMDGIMAKHPRIEQNPEIMFGKPVVKGTRVTVEQILRELGGGLSPDEVVTNHPNLSLTDIQAAEAFAADYLADEEVSQG
jgi:uncharacterized protein (DUF433 family)